MTGRSRQAIHEVGPDNPQDWCHRPLPTPGRMKLALAGGRLYTLGWPGVLKSSISLFSSSPA